MREDKCCRCDRASFFGLTHPPCRRRGGIDGAKSIYYYGPVIKKIITNIKYRLVLDALSDLLKEIPQTKKEELFFLKSLDKKFTIIPVPLFPLRHARRGFNQALEIARFFSSLLGYPIYDDLVTRLRNTKPQAEFKKNIDRYKNTLGAFGLVKNQSPAAVFNQKFIIVDDVWTTGSTIKEVAKVLKRAGAKYVFALTLAR